MLCLFQLSVQKKWWRLLGLTGTVALLSTLLTVQRAGASWEPSSPPHAVRSQHSCNANGPLCAEPFQNWEEFSWFNNVAARMPMSEYIGHDEPSIVYYSDQAGSGNSNDYLIKLPTDPPVVPRQHGNGGTYNFQLRPAFWLGMAMCDNASAPNPGRWGRTRLGTVPCKRDSDANIYESKDPSSSHYLGLHPGTAFMEMQFYPPSWARLPLGTSCSAHQWCAALTIDSLSLNMNSNKINNFDCLFRTGIEPVNFAFLTNDGRSWTPAHPLNPDRFTIPRDAFLMGSGDQLHVRMFDTRRGFKVVLSDLTSGRTGSMTASKANGFGKVRFKPAARKCSVHPSPFHPEYSTASPRTRVPWAAHSYNVASSDEIGHFEYCARTNKTFMSCKRPLGSDTHNGDQDDYLCLPGSLSTLIRINGCLGADGDFDGPSYGHNWPGSFSDAVADKRLHPSPLMFSSPSYRADNGTNENYSRIAFESNLPRIEGDDSVFHAKPCQRHISNPADAHPGRHCVNPPPGADFYPFYSTTMLNGTCVWQEGGRFLPASRRFGGEKAEYGKLLRTHYAAPDRKTTARYNNFRRILDSNPCPRTDALQP